MKNKLIEIQKAVADLDQARQLHEYAVSGLSSIRGLRGQDGYSVTVGGIRVDVAVNAGREGGYQAKLVRGREMIHLGALKALQALIDDRADIVRAKEKFLKVLVGELAHDCP